MTPSDPSPKPPTWLLIAIDLVLLGVAAAVAANAPKPLSNTVIFVVIACAIVGALIVFYPIVAHYERVKNEALDDRQRALEALARTLTSSAEQISIAANGLHEVAELAQKNLRQAEHLPQKLHERIAEFEARLAATQDAEKDELEKELVALRTSESERLDAVSDKISKSAADWAKLEISTQKNLAASRETIERAATDAVAHLTASLPAALNAATAAASAAASQSISAATAQAERSLADLQSAAAAKHEAALAAAQTHAAAALDERITALTASLATATSDALAKIDATLATGATRLETAVTEAVKSIPVAPSVAPAPLAPSPSIEETTPAAAPVATAAPATTPEATPTESPAVAPEPHAHPPKRPRKPRRS